MGGARNRRKEPDMTDTPTPDTPPNDPPRRLYRVTWQNRGTETYEVAAAGPEEAEALFAEEGRLVGTSEHGEVLDAEAAV